MRILRNNVAHAFGRNIEAARSRGLTILDSAERVQLERLKKWMGLIKNIVREMDTYLLNNHIGEYESIYLYHVNRDSIIIADRVTKLRKLLNREDICQLRSGVFCKKLIEYYEIL